MTCALHWAVWTPNWKPAFFHGGLEKGTFSPPQKNGPKNSPLIFFKRLQGQQWQRCLTLFNVPRFHGLVWEFTNTCTFLLKRISLSEFVIFFGGFQHHLQEIKWWFKWMFGGKHIADPWILYCDAEYWKTLIDFTTWAWSLWKEVHWPYILYFLWFLDVLGGHVSFQGVRMCILEYIEFHPISIFRSGLNFPVFSIVAQFHSLIIPGWLYIPIYLWWRLVGIL